MTIHTPAYADLIPEEIKTLASASLERIEAGRGPEFARAREHVAAMPVSRRDALEAEWEGQREIRDWEEL